MVEEEKGHDGTEGSSPATVDPERPGNRWLLLFGVILAVAFAGFYSSYEPAAPDPRPVGSTAQAGLPPLPPVQAPQVAAAPPENTLAFLREGLYEKPASVESLVEESKRVVGRLVEGLPNSTDTLEIAGRLHFRLGDSAAAAAAWERCLELDPGYAYAYEGLASIAGKKGEYEQAASLYRRALELNEQAHETQINLAQVLIDSNQTDEAISLLEKNVASDPRPYRGRVLLGMAYAQLHDYEKSKDNYLAAIESHPLHANAHNGLAQAYARLGERELAHHYMEKFRELRAGEREIGSRERTEFDDLDTMCIDAAGTYVDAARVCLAHGKLFEAETLAARASALDAENVDSRQALAWIYLQLGRPDETIGVLQQLAAMQPADMGIPLEIARLYAATGQTTRAEQTLRDVCEQAPQDAAGFVALANFYLQENRDAAEALDVARTALNLDPSAANHALVAVACQRNGDVSAAIAELEEAARLAPETVQYQQMLDSLKANPANPAQ